MVKKIILKKNKGNVTSLVIGQLFMLVLLIWCLFNYRLKMLNTAFNYIDDALTSSTLGAAIVNTQEFGKSHQILIHNSDVYVDNSSDAWTGSKNIDYNGWEEFEAKILLSELNYKSDIVMQPSEIGRAHV